VSGRRQMEKSRRSLIRPIVMAGLVRIGARLCD
jgi:hypothetical protein